MRGSYFDINNFFNAFSDFGDKSHLYPKHWINRRFNDDDSYDFDSDLSSYSDSDEDMIEQVPVTPRRRIILKKRSTTPKIESKPNVRKEVAATVAVPIPKEPTIQNPTKQPEEYDPFVEWTDDNNNDQVSQNTIVQINGVGVSRSSLSTLLGHTWLDDGVINAYLSLLYSDCESKNLKCYMFAPCSTNFYEMLKSPKHSYDYEEYNYNRVMRWTKKVSIMKMDKVLVPICINGNHWVLAVINLRERKFEFYDSMIWDDTHTHIGNNILNKLSRYLDEEVLHRENVTLNSNRWRRFLYGPSEIPQQDNGHDCGVFLCMFAKHVCQDKNMNFKQEDMPEIRHKLLSCILNKNCNF
ncbi:ulp-1 [Acrasis kona]|uniref:Ulp-1 n=1 Tax=Acrasis kona TaxID=1008807 RepID=A0AAW2YJP7_9EUKA